MISTVFVNPPLLMPWLPEKQRDENVLLLDLGTSTPDGTSIRFDLNIIFQPIKLVSGIVTVRYRYVGTTGAHISIELYRNTVKNWTQESTLDVQYGVIIRGGKEGKIALAPSLKLKSGEVEAEAKPGAISFTKDSSVERSLAFAAKEFVLAPTQWRTGVNWTYSLPEGPKVMRDFLVGNLRLFAEFDGPAEGLSGRIRLEPENIRFFSSKRKPVSAVRALYMHGVLWKRNITIQSPHGLEFTLRDQQ